MVSEDFRHQSLILDQVEAAFKKLAKQENLSESFIERWRWDIPSIYVLWNDSDEIRKNITTYIRQEKLHQYLAVEVNAWRDKDKDDVRIRHWKHDNTGQLLLPVNDDVLWNKIYDSYTYVCDWSEAMLTEVATAPVVQPTVQERFS